MMMMCPLEQEYGKPKKNMLWLAIEVQTFLSLVADERGMRGFAFMWRRHDKQLHRVVLKSPLDNEAKSGLRVCQYQ